jgi:hypothetical protein
MCLFFESGKDAYQSDVNAALTFWQVGSAGSED